MAEWPFLERQFEHLRSFHDLVPFARMGKFEHRFHRPNQLRPVPQILKVHDAYGKLLQPHARLLWLFPPMLQKRALPTIKRSVPM